jgi:tRNA (guanine-N7-)-methyltransferase
MQEPATPAPRRYLELAPRAPDGAIDLHALWGIDIGDIELEIGFGRGMFLIERAKSAPQARLLGIEIKSKWAFKVAERARRELSRPVVEEASRQAAIARRFDARADRAIARARR